MEAYIPNNDVYDYILPYIFIKVLMLGDPYVGKSNILSRITKNVFGIESKPTIGVECGFRDHHIGNKLIKAQFWDNAGQERYRSIKFCSYREAMGALIVYDITNHSTFKNVEWWLKELRNYTDGNNVTIMLVGNKSDLNHHRQVSIEEAKSFAEKEKLLFIETSALDATNVEEVFTHFITRVYNNVTNL